MLKIAENVFHVIADILNTSHGRKYRQAEDCIDSPAKEKVFQCHDVWQEAESQRVGENGPNSRLGNYPVPRRDLTRTMNES